MSIHSGTIAVFVFSFLLSMACKKHHVEDKPDPSVEPAYPSYFPKPHYEPVKNKLSKDGIALGRMLFYDPLLSLDSTVSCGSCHAQAHAFSGHNTAFSKGIHNRMGKRNTPALYNLAWNTSFMADGGINHIEVMSLAPMTNPDEMGETLPGIIRKLQRSKKYPALFEKTFGAGPVNDQKLLFALAQFMSTIVSTDSKYDRYRQGKAIFSEDEQNGLQLFRTHCASCHSEPLLTDFSFRNNGIDSVFKDKGRETITSEPSDRGKFKVPSLRNIGHTYPYMHDGRYYTLEEVLNHYTNVKPSATLDTLLTKPITLSAPEKKQVILFLKTLTDYTYLANRNYSEPQ